MPRVDINCDMGESFGRYQLGDDAAMLRVVTSANVACGMHAGDPVVMRRTVALAAEQGVAVGAHPGYPDLQGFGRRSMGFSAGDLENYLLFQLGALAGVARAAGVSLRHVKPHGALYNAAIGDRGLALAVVRAVAAFDPALVVVTLPVGILAEEARKAGLVVAHEGFADRAYYEDGTLVPRSEPGAVVREPERAAARAVRMATEGEVEAITGKVIAMAIDTLCVHGDTPGAPQIAARLRAALRAAGVEVAPLRSP